MPHPKIVTYEEVRTRTSELMRAMTRLPIVGISGHGGAGKSTLAARLVTDLGGTAEQVISTDRFYAAGAGPGSDLFSLHDWPALLDLLGRLRTAPTPQRLVYPVRTYDGTERTCDVPMPRVIVVEGIRLLRPEAAALLDLTVWIDRTPEDAGRRAVERNREQGDDPAELDLWRTKWIPEGHAYEELINPRRLADLVVH